MTHDCRTDIVTEPVLCWIGTKFEPFYVAESPIGFSCWA